MLWAVLLLTFSLCSCCFLNLEVFSSSPMPIQLMHTHSVKLRVPALPWSLFHFPRIKWPYLCSLYIPMNILYVSIIALIQSIINIYFFILVQVISELMGYGGFVVILWFPVPVITLMLLSSNSMFLCPVL